MLNPDSKLTLDMSPYNELTVPIYDIWNIKIFHPSDRPVRKIHLCRESSDIVKKDHFVKTARILSLSALTKSRNKPFMCSELAHKLAEDVDQGVLLKMDDFF